jgi:8-oxo-dGTP pyrophosphatase MutT (NUDIX family)
MSDVPKLLGSTKPEESLARQCEIRNRLSNTVVLVQSEPAGGCWNLVGGQVEPILQ